MSYLFVLNRKDILIKKEKEKEEPQGSSFSLLYISYGEKA